MCRPSAGIMRGRPLTVAQPNADGGDENDGHEIEGQKDIDIRVVLTPITLQCSVQLFLKKRT